jgi:hypothetical protein
VRVLAKRASQQRQLLVSSKKRLLVAVRGLKKYMRVINIGHELGLSRQDLEQQGYLPYTAGKYDTLLRRLRRHLFPQIRLIHTLRRSLAKSLRLEGVRKSQRTVKYLGCSFDAFRKYIEARFVEGETWENYGRLWHLDHVRPLASFNWTHDGDASAKAAWHYTNLQPMLARENESKGSLYGGRRWEHADHV